MKSIFEFVAEIAVKYKEGRKIALLGRGNEIFNSLMRLGVDHDNVLILGDDYKNVSEGLNGKSKDFYLIVGNRERDVITKKNIEALGYREIYDYMFVYGIKRFVTQKMYVNVKETDTMNIMGTVSLGRMPYVLPHLQMLQNRNPGKLIRFYLFYHASLVPETKEAFQRIARYAKIYKNIEFHGVPVGNEDDEYRELLQKYIGLKNWTSQSFELNCTPYYVFLAHKYLPQSLDRIMYIDIGDTIINDNLSPFYYEDFENKSMLVTIGMETRVRDSNGILRPFCSDDCKNPAYLKRIGHEIFNGGVKLINLIKWRQLNYSIHDYLKYAHDLQEKYHLGDALLYDQGLLGFLFLDDIKFYKIKEFNDEKYMPFNHVSYMFCDLDGTLKDTYYSPAIVHFCGPRNVKPFFVKYPQKLKVYQDGLSLMKGCGKAEKYYLQWYDAALKAEQIMENVDKNYVPENILDICQCNIFDEYLHYLEALGNKYLVCIAIKDTAGYGISDYLAGKLTAMGIADLRQEGRWSYVFAKVKGKVLLNKLNGFETVIEDSIVYENHMIKMTSKSYNKGAEVNVLIDGKDYAVNCRGLNIVVFDLDNERLVDTVGFDTVFKNNPCYRKPDLYYAVNSLSSQNKSFHEIVSHLSGRKYDDIMCECSEIIEKIEGHAIAERGC